MAAPKAKIGARKNSRVSKSVQKRKTIEPPPSGVRRSKRILELQNGTTPPGGQPPRSQKRRQEVVEDKEIKVSRPAKRRKLSPEQGPKQSGKTLPKPQSDKQAPNHPPVELLQTQFAAPGSNGLGTYKLDQIKHWAAEGQVWPEDFYQEDPMDRITARRRVSAATSRSGKRSEVSAATTVTPIEPVGDKSAPYKNPNYESIMAEKGASFMHKFEAGISPGSKRLCQDLLTRDQPVPKDSLFRDDIFDSNCETWRNKNEATIFRDCTPLIVPPWDPYFALTSARGLKIAVESVNEGWNCSLPITKTRPQPDCSVGYSLQAFSQDQLRKLQPAIGDATSQSYFMGTSCMIFPFLTCEVKCGTGGLDIADRQNLHSMTLAVRGIVELFRLAGRLAEIDRNVLAFSVSHDNENIRIFGHFPVLGEDKSSVTYWRTSLRRIDFIDRDGYEKWTAYKFVKNIYDVWMPAHLQRLCDLIDQLPEKTTTPSSVTADSRDLPSSGLSQRLSNQHFDATATDPFRINGSGPVTPETLASQDGPALKRTKTTRN